MNRESFQAGGPLMPNATSYVERVADHEMLQYVQQMAYIQITEPRQQGKTSLILRLASKLQDGVYRLVYLDAESLSDKDEASWYMDLAIRLIHELQDHIDCSTLVRPWDSVSWRTFLVNLGTAKSLEGDHRPRLIIALDEVGSIPPLWAENFFKVLREIYHSQRFNSSYPRGNMRDEKPEEQVKTAQLRQLLINHFDESELRTLCFDIEVDYESLPGQSKADKARELAAYVRRHGQIGRLLSKCQEIRQHVDWQSVVAQARQAAPSERAHPWVAFILVGAFDPRDLIQNVAISPFNIAQKVSVEDFTKEEVRLMAGWFGLPPAQTEELAERIAYWTDGQPYLLQKLCTYLSKLDEHTLTSASVDDAVNKFFREDSIHLPRMMKDLQENPDLLRYMHKITQSNVRYSPAVNPLQYKLAHVIGVIKPDEQGYCRFRNRLYERALQDIEVDLGQSHVPHQTPAPPRFYDPPARPPDPRVVTPPPLPVAALRPQGEQAPSEVPLTLRFEIKSNGIEIDWEADVLGVRQSRFVSPYSGTDLALVVRGLDLLQYPSASLTPTELAQLRDLGLPTATSGLGNGGHRAVGRALYKALVADRHGAEALSTVRNYARAEGRPLALRLRLPPDAIELAALPWELLWDEGAAPLLLGHGQLAGCTRHLDLAEAVPPLRQRKGPLRILAITPHSGIEPEAREREHAERTAAWAPLIASGEVVMEEITPATRRAISERMLIGPRPDIVHFVGHGHYLDGEGWLVIDTQSGGWDRVSASRLMPLFGEVRLVALMACQGARSGDGGLLTGIAPALSAAGVPAVVAMQLTVRATAVIRFSEVMYSALARGESLQRAVVQARQALYVEEEEGVSWYVPTVTIRARNPGPLYLFGG